MCELGCGKVGVGGGEVFDLRGRIINRYNKQGETESWPLKERERGGR